MAAQISSTDLISRFIRVPPDSDVCFLTSIIPYDVFFFNTFFACHSFLVIVQPAATWWIMLYGMESWVAPLTILKDHQTTSRETADHSANSQKIPWFSVRTLLLYFHGIWISRENSAILQHFLPPGSVIFCQNGSKVAAFRAPFRTRDYWSSGNTDRLLNSNHLRNISKRWW